MNDQAGGTDPFTTLGLPARADLTDDDVRSAWRRIAAATHPDRADGGDPSRFAMAAGAYTVLRTRSGRGEALADLASRAPGPSTPGRPRPRAGSTLTRRPRAAPATTPWALPPRPGPRPGPWRVPSGGGLLLSRIRRGRPARLALRLVIAAVLSGVAVAVAGSQPAAPALITGALTWLLLTAPHDLAPPS